MYILKCGDGSFYTGIAMDVAARVGEHTRGAGAKYTKGRGPFEVIFTEVFANKSDALKREYAIKTLTRAQKQMLVRSC